MEADKATLRQNLLRLASLAETFGGKPSDYHDADEGLCAYARFCIDEAALIVLGSARKKALKDGQSDTQTGDKAEANKGEPPSANNASVFEGMKARADAARKLAQLKAMTR